MKTLSSQNVLNFLYLLYYNGRMICLKTFLLEKDLRNFFLTYTHNYASSCLKMLQLQLNFVVYIAIAGQTKLTRRQSVWFS